MDIERDINYKPNSFVSRDFCVFFVCVFLIVSRPTLRGCRSFVASTRTISVCKPCFFVSIESRNLSGLQISHSQPGPFTILRIVESFSRGHTCKEHPERSMLPPLRQCTERGPSQFRRCAITKLTFTSFHLRPSIRCSGFTMCVSASLSE